LTKTTVIVETNHLTEAVVSSSLKYINQLGSSGGLEGTGLVNTRSVV